MEGSRLHRIALLATPDFQILDVTGPHEVFSIATRLLRRAGRRGGYRIELVAPEAGPLRASSGLQLHAERGLRGLRAPLDTLLVAGGEGIEAAARDPRVVRFVARQGGKAGRVASVCSGAVLLAAAGLLDGRRATTHWVAAERLAEAFPAVEVDPEPIYVRDGRIWTSAGITAGMDLALALVEEDFGRELALEVARWMVLFLRRPGGQSQFSAQLAAQVAQRDPLRDVQAHIADHPEADLSVEALARRAGMSPRHFARVFAEQVGTTPARYVERVRVETARRHLEESDLGLDEVAARCGFGSAETLRRAFQRGVRVSPGDYRMRFRSRPRREERRRSA